MNGSAVVAIVSVLTTGIAAPLIGYFTGALQFRRLNSKERQDEERGVLDEAAASLQHQWWAFNGVVFDWRRGMRSDSEVVLEDRRDFNRARASTSAFLPRLSIRLGPDHPISKAFEELIVFTNEMAEFLYPFEHSDATYEKQDFEVILLRHRELRRNFLALCHEYLESVTE